MTLLYHDFTNAWWQTWVIGNLKFWISWTGAMFGAGLDVSRATLYVDKVKAIPDYRQMHRATNIELKLLIKTMFAAGEIKVR
jgi:hypothetical protein